MKTKLIAVFATVMAMTFGTLISNAQNQNASPYDSNPGIVIAGSQNYSQLPDKAKHFISKHFKNVGVSKCEKFFAKGQYEVELTNGIDIEFNLKGEITEIDAPDNTFLSVAVVKDMMHHKSFSRLEKDGLADKVESIEFKKWKVCEVEVGIAAPDTYIFDIDGNFIAIED